MITMSAGVGLQGTNSGLPHTATGGARQSVATAVGGRNPQLNRDNIAQHGVIIDLEPLLG
jgi:ABC-type thiamine transport system ATPase subunit